MSSHGFYSVDSLSGVHVLIVDDDDDCGPLLRSILEYCGALVTTAASVADGLKIMSIVKCDILVADVVMPVEDGYVLIRKVRALKPEDGGVVRAIAIGRHDREDARQEALAAGFDGYLVKPIEPWAFCRLVAALAVVTRR